MSDEPTRPIDPSDDHTRSLDDTLPDFDDLPDLPPGTTIGRYTIESVLGAGGMGAVYKATQQSPHRTVALKLMKHGAVSPRALRRFELESEVLGKLTHPGIAQIHEAGMHNGAPFFAMEYVPGQILTDYAQSHNLSTHQRLELFAKICNAVHHAHTKGVIHRDLKPHNILVTEQGEPPQPQPKILDFGVARATDADVQSATIRTDVGQLIGTIPYMSPEQVAADPSDIDTRSDVYALGVVLYELLAGRMPYDIERKLIHEAARVIREDEPTRLSSINTTLRGDVETIVAKALEKERDRRYQSALDLGSDIQRYLNDEPIAARPPSTWYQLTKFSKRNKALVTGTAAAFAFLLLGLVGTTYGLIEANTQRERVEQANTTLRAQNNNARSAIEELLVVSGVFDQYNLAPGQTTSAFIESEDESTPNHYFTLRGADDGSIIIDPDESHQSNTRINDTFAAALPALALEYTKQALERERARIHELEQVTEFQSAQLAEIDPPTMGLKLREDLLEKFRARDERAGYDEEEITARLTTLDEFLNGVDFTGMALESLEENIFERAIEAIDTQLADQPLVQAQILHAVASTTRKLGLLTISELTQRRVLELRQRELPESHPSIAIAAGSLGHVYSHQGRYELSESYFSEAVATFWKESGRAHPHTLTSLNGLGLTLEGLGRFDEAEQVFREVVAISSDYHGVESENYLAGLSNLANNLVSVNKLDEAERYLCEVLESRIRIDGLEHRDTISVMNKLAGLYAAQRKYDKSIPYFRSVLNARIRLLGRTHPSVVASLNNMGGVLWTVGDLDGAEGYFQESLQISRQIYGDSHSTTLICLNSIGSLLWSRGELDDAEAIYREVLETRSSVLGDHHRLTISSLGTLGVLLESKGDLDGAEQLYVISLERSRAVLGDSHPDTLLSLNNLGAIQSRRGQFHEAVETFVQALESALVALGPDHPDTLEFMSNIAKLLSAQSLYDQAEAYVVESLDRRLRIAGTTGPGPIKAMEETIEFYLAWHQSDPTANHDQTAADYQAQLDQILANQESQPNP